eukprot:m.132999 g.132999  ORF g.132999 m.132999 type:complete len:363 (-) comp23793_c0_seq1:37-1125(-)
MDVGFDVWNEPNAYEKVHCLATNQCTFDANLTQDAFFKLYDVAFKTAKSILPNSRIIAPSIADGGPEIFGFVDSVFPWLQQFLLHTFNANTLPDVLTWHVSGIHNASLLAEHHQMLREWATAQGIPLPKIGHNEFMGPPQTLEPAANLAFLSVLDQLKVDHSCRACWVDSVTGVSPCWDNSLDALLTDNCNKTVDPPQPFCDTLQPRPVYFAYQYFGDIVGQLRALFSIDAGSSCASNLAGIATSMPATGATRGGSSHSSASSPSPPFTVLLGRWENTSFPLTQTISVTFEGLPPNPSSSTSSYELVVERIHVDDEREPGKTELVVKRKVQVQQGGSLVVDLGEVEQRDVWRVKVQEENEEE